MINTPLPYQIMCGSDSLDISVSRREDFPNFGGRVRLVFDTTDIRIYDMLNRLAGLTDQNQTPYLLGWKVTTPKNHHSYKGDITFRSDKFDFYFKAMPFQLANQNISIGYGINPKKPKCDCGAVSCGYSNTPGPSHSKWCDLMKQGGIDL